MLNLSQTFQQFFNAEKASGFVLLLATLLALLVVNLTTGETYHAFWHYEWIGLSLEHWVNDCFMAVFFLLIGLELERELYNGELSSFSNALLPLIAAVGGMVMPALLYWSLNHGTAYQSGIGISMATDIAFALGVLSMLGQRVPSALKVFLVAFAVIDDLGAALMIALFYTASISMPYLIAAISVWIFLVILNRLRVMHMLPYLVGGALMWWLTLQSGVHATLAGIALAFAIPFSAHQDDAASPSHRLEHALHKPVAFLILPLFAFANTGVSLSVEALQSIVHQDYSLGILAGLIIGKPLGVFLAALLAVGVGLTRLPEGIRWSHIIGAGMLGGIGFTMSIFVTNLAFTDQPTVINTAKIAILGGSLIAGLAGGFWLTKTLDR